VGSARGRGGGGERDPEAGPAGKRRKSLSAMRRPTLCCDHQSTAAIDDQTWTQQVSVEMPFRI